MAIASSDRCAILGQRVSGTTVCSSRRRRPPRSLRRKESHRWLLLPSDRWVANQETENNKRIMILSSWGLRMGEGFVYGVFRQYVNGWRDLSLQLIKYCWLTGPFSCLFYVKWSNFLAVLFQDWTLLRAILCRRLGPQNLLVPCFYICNNFPSYKMIEILSFKNWPANRSRKMLTFLAVSCWP